ncbi:hypothetical protein CRUP_010520, partial [Coryphaenoides rupestris]
MQHRMIKEAQKAMVPWVGGQPVYSAMSHHSSQINPMLYSGSASGHSVPLKAMPLPPPHSMAYSMPPQGIHGNTPTGNNQMLDYLETQMRGMDMNSPLMQPMPPPHHHQPQMGPPPGLSVPFSPGPPSMLSALNDDGPTERRVITLPPIREQLGARIPPPAPKTRPPSSSESSRTGYAYRRDDRGGGGGGGGGGSRVGNLGRPRSRSRDDLYDSRSRSREDLYDSRSRSREDLYDSRSRSREDLYDSRSRGNHSPPASHRSHRNSWSSDDEDSSRRGGGGGGGRGRRGGGRGGGGGGGGAWGDNPPSYTEYEPGSKPGARRNERFS